MSNPFVNGLLLSRLKAAEIAASVAGDLRRSSVAEVLADAEEIHAWITAGGTPDTTAARPSRRASTDDPFAVDLPAAPPEAMPTAKSDNYIKVLWNVYVHLSETVNGWTEAQIRRQVKASPLNLGPYEVRRWGESWGKVTKKNYLVQSATSSTRWELDKHLVENELGFSAEAADYYREFVLEDPGAEAGNDPDDGAGCDECQRLYGWHDPRCSSYVPDTRTLREKMESIR